MVDSDRRPRRLRGRHWIATAIAVGVVAWSAAASACDLCAIYTTTELRETATGVLVGVGEQFTHFGTLQLDGERVSNPEDEYLDSSITQILIGYRPFSRFGLQLNLPIISRHFRRAVAGGAQHGDESGFGDLSLIGDLDVFSWADLSTIVRLSAFGGLKLPSGDSSRLREEADEGDDLPSHEFPDSFRGPRANHEHGDVQSGIHGHDLALGSGSVDGILGGRVYTSWNRLFFSGATQYLLRTKGDFDYHYANELLWNAGPGLFVLSGHDERFGVYTVALQSLLSGETKGRDTFDGSKADDTAITSMYIGPRLSVAIGTSFSVDLAGDLPVLQNNSALQIVPDYRVRGGIGWKF